MELTPYIAAAGKLVKFCERVLKQVKSSQRVFRLLELRKTMCQVCREMVIHFEPTNDFCKEAERTVLILEAEVRGNFSFLQTLVCSEDWEGKIVGNGFIDAQTMYVMEVIVEVSSWIACLSSIVSSVPLGADKVVIVTYQETTTGKNIIWMMLQLVTCLHEVANEDNIQNSLFLLNNLGHVLEKSEEIDYIPTNSWKGYLQQVIGAQTAVLFSKTFQPLIPGLRIVDLPLNPRTTQRILLQKLYAFNMMFAQQISLLSDFSLQTKAEKDNFRTYVWQFLGIPYFRFLDKLEGITSRGNKKMTSEKLVDNKIIYPRELFLSIIYDLMQVSHHSIKFLGVPTEEALKAEIEVLNGS